MVLAGGTLELVVEAGERMVVGDLRTGLASWRGPEQP